MLDSSEVIDLRARLEAAERERDESRNVEDQALARARVAESGLRRLRESYDKLASEREALLTVHNQELEHYKAVLPKLSDAESRAEAADRLLKQYTEALGRMKLAWRNLSPDTLSPQEILNSIAWALNEPRRAYSGDMHPDKSLFDLVRERDAARADMKEQCARHVEEWAIGDAVLQKSLLLSVANTMRALPVE